MSSFRSLCFFDTESTDLPHARPTITEISLVACSANHFENVCGQIVPRVLHKLTLCVNPGQRINPEAVILTGLDNFLLEDENRLDIKTLRLLTGFIEHLQQPVCLIAHNGNAFDFPLLAKSFRTHGMMLSVQCADSLVLFKKIDADEDQLKAFLDSELEELNNEEEDEEVVDQQQSSQSTSRTERTESPDLFMDDENEVDEATLTQLTEKAEQSYFNETTPVNKRIPVQGPPEIPKKPTSRRIDRTFLKPRQLFSTRSYKLTMIYQRFFGSVPGVAHRAEDDTMMLLHCARFKARDFLAKLSENSRELSSFVK